jgi:hypothetical protein
MMEKQKNKVIEGRKLTDAKKLPARSKRRC